MIWVAGWAVSAVGIAELFDRIDQALKPATRRSVARWLRGLDPGKSIAPLAEQIGAMFDIVFGTRHLSWRCVLSSFVMTFFTMSLATLFAWALNPHRFDFPGIWRDWPVPILWWTAVLSAVPNYLSLLETRWIIKQIALSRSLINTVDLMLLGLLLTTATVLISIWLGFATTLVLVTSEASATTVFSPWWGIAVVGTALLNHGPFIFLTVCLWAGFAPAFWSLLYGASAIVLRLAQSTSVWLRVARKWFDVEKRPVRCLGFFAVLIWTLGLVVTRFFAAI